MRLGHLAAFSAGRLGTLVDIRFQDGSILFDDMQFGQIDPDFSIELDAGTHDLLVTDADGDEILLDPVPFSISEGDLVSLLLAGDRVNQPLEFFKIVNGERGTFVPLEGENSDVYITHLAPFANNIQDTRVSLTVDGVNLLINFAYGDSTGQYVDISPGIHRLEIIPNDPTYPTIQKTFEFSGGDDYTLLLTGDGVRQDIDLLLVEDDNQEPEGDQTKTRVGHVAPFGSGLAVRVDFLSQQGQAILSDIDYLSTSADYLLNPEGVFNLKITTLGGSAVLVDPGPVNLNRGDVSSLWFTGDGVNQPLGMYLIRNGGRSEFLSLELDAPGVDLPQLNVAHLAPLIPGDAAVELKIDGQLIDAMFNYGESTGYSGVTEGLHLVEIVAAGTNSVIMSRSINVRSGRYYSVFAVGDGAVQNLELVAYESVGAKSLDPERAQITAINLAPFSDQVSAIVADIRDQSGEELFNSLAYKIPQERYVDRGNYNLLVTSNDGSVVFIDPLPITLENGDAATLIITGDGDQGNQEMQVYMILNGTPGNFVENFSGDTAPIRIYFPIMGR